MARPRQVARGVELFPARTPTLPPATHTNSYALGERELLLVEPATPHDDERRAWLDWARALTSTGRRAMAILVTHHHADHVGGAAFFQAELALPLWAHRRTAELLPDLRFDHLLDDGEEVTLGGEAPSRWTALHTPGHAPGHLCFFEAETRTLIAGDMVASVGTIVIDPHEGDMAEYLRQLARLADLDAEVALPAHGEPISKDGDRPSPAELFRFYIEHRLKREAKVLSALDRAPPEGASLEALLPVVYADTPVLLWPVARLSLWAHLNKIEAEGRARVGAEGWVKVG